MEKAKLSLLAMLCLLFAGVVLYGQQGMIVLRNASFEDQPSHSKTPKEWIDCGFEGESEPDIQPSGEFGVTTLPFEGDTYLGMVVRDNETWERVSQRLNSPMVAGKCYSFSIYLAKSPQYLSKSRLKNQLANYIQGVRLRIYGGSSPCSYQELLAQSPVINDPYWTKFEFILKPIQSHSFIFFEAFYEKSKMESYNGNILLDGASALIPIVCDDTISTIIKTSLNESFAESKESTASLLSETPKFRKGKLIPLKDIKFAAGRSDLTNTGFIRLDRLIELLTLYPTLIVEINVHLNYRYDKSVAEDLSVRRAASIEQYLLENLVKKNRFKVKGWGNSQPSNPNLLNDDDERIEIKVADF